MVSTRLPERIRSRQPSTSTPTTCRCNLPSPPPILLSTYLTHPNNPSNTFQFTLSILQLCYYPLPLTHPNQRYQYPITPTSSSCFLTTTTHPCPCPCRYPPLENTSKWLAEASDPSQPLSEVFITHTAACIAELSRR